MAGPRLTQEFRSTAVRKATREETTFAEATTHIKCRFLEVQIEERNTDPFWRPPFVYYRREEQRVLSGAGAGGAGPIRRYRRTSAAKRVFILGSPAELVALNGRE